MTRKIISCVSLPPATITSVPIYNYAVAIEELTEKDMEQYFPCCGKSICKGCILSFLQSGNEEKCPFCKTEIIGKTAEEHVDEIRKRVEANDAASIRLLANSYHHGLHGIQQDHAKAIKLFTKSAELGFIEAHYQLGSIYENGGDLKKAKLHYENAAMAGHAHARFHLGGFEAQAGNVERAKPFDDCSICRAFYCHA
jgi:TPR repeat protein